MQRPKRPPGGKRKWDDPDSDASDKEAEREEKLEQEHAKWGMRQGLGGDEDDDEDEDLKGSDSDGEAEGQSDFGAELISDLLGRRAAPQRKQSSAAEEDGGLWDPLAGLGPRKKRKIVDPVAPVGSLFADTPPARKGVHAGQRVSASGRVKGQAAAGFPEGTTVCLHGLLKAPELNGQTGTVQGPVDGATGRCPVLLANGSVKSLRQENLRQVFTGAVVRLKGLQSAAELNGRIGECGRFDLSSGRYDVVLADEAAGAPPKRVKEENLDLMRRFVTLPQMLSAQRRPFSWKEALERARDRASRTWPAQLALLKECRLPAPRLLTSQALKKFADACKADPKAARKALVSSAILADRAPVDADGFLTCRLLAVSTERDSCCPADAPRDGELQRLGVACGELANRTGGEPMYFLLPTMCVKNLPCLRDAASCAWPLYLQLCQALLCVDTEYRAAKSWCRIEQLAAGASFSKPVYILPKSGVSQRKDSSDAGDLSGWLLSDHEETVELGAPSDGHVLPSERQLAEQIAGEVLAGGWRSKASLKCYRL